MQKHTILLVIGIAILTSIATVLFLSRVHEKKVLADTIAPSQNISLDQTLESLIQCESGWKNVKIIDTNGYYSYGILQFQKSTWDELSEKSGIVGSPMDQMQSIEMAKWAILHGYEKRWSCWKTLSPQMQSVSQDISG